MTEELSLKIEHYEGPLDLLLALIAKNKIDILDIPIAEITEQYMQYIDSMKKLDMEVTAEFIVMAAHLMLIKSRMLLPRRAEEEDPRKTLVDALLERKRAAETAAFLKLRSETYYDSFTKDPDEIDMAYEREHAVSLLKEAFDRMAERASVLQKSEKQEKLFASLREEKYYTVEEKMLSVSLFLNKHGDTEFERLFYGCEGKSEMIAVFLALLELASRQEITVYIEDGQTVVAPSAAQLV